MIDLRRKHPKPSATQLRKGIRVELEHTTSRKKARRIAEQHLVEFPTYYTHLIRMEARLKKRR